MINWWPNQKSFKSFIVPTRSTGMTLIEVVVVAGVIAVLIWVLFLALRTQLDRGRDARRKADLERIKVAFEDYYNDKTCYPPSDILDNCNGDELQPYLERIPCDPVGKEPYLYIPDQTNQCSGYRLFAPLQDHQDPAIVKLGCSETEGCYVGPGYEEYNYGVAAGLEVPMGGPSGGGGGGSSLIYACSPAGGSGSGTCNVYQDAEAAGCPTTFTDDECSNQCGDSSTWCDI